MQLTWAYNYKEASLSIYKDDRLLRDPGLVSSNEQTAWLTSFWFWKKRVQPKPAVRIRGEFGTSTKIINGGAECGKGRKEDVARKRFEIYKKVLVAFNIAETANEYGCYDMNK
jgi:predicted chitinase